MGDFLHSLDLIICFYDVCTNYHAVYDSQNLISYNRFGWLLGNKRPVKRSVIHIFLFGDHMFLLQQRSRMCRLYTEVKTAVSKLHLNSTPVQVIQAWNARCLSFILYSSTKEKRLFGMLMNPYITSPTQAAQLLHKHCVSFVKHRNPVQMEDVQPFDFQIEATLKKQKKNDWITTRWSVLFTLQCKTVHLVYSLPIFIIFILKIAFDLRKLKL